MAESSHILKFHESILSNVWRYQFMYFSKRSDQPFSGPGPHDRIKKNIKIGEYDAAKKVLIAHMSYEQIVNDKGVNLSA